MITRQLIIMALLVIGTVSPVARSAAFLTSSIAQAGSGSAFSTATIEFTQQFQSSNTFVSFTNLFPTSNPADASYLYVQVDNTGTGTLRYSASTLVDSGITALASALQMTVKKMTATTTCNSTDFEVNGALIYGTAGLSGGLALANSTTASLEVIPSTELAPDAAANDIYCFRVLLPLTAANALQNATTTIKFEFAAKQASGT